MATVVIETPKRCRASWSDQLHDIWKLATNLHGNPIGCTCNGKHSNLTRKIKADGTEHLMMSQCRIAQLSREHI